MPPPLTTPAAGAAGKLGGSVGTSMHPRPKVEIPATPLCVDHRLPLEFMCGPCRQYICTSCFTGHGGHRHHGPILRLADQIHQMVHAMTPGLIELEIKTLASVQYLEAQAVAYQQHVQEWSQAAHRMLSMFQTLYGSDDFPSVPRMNGLMQLNQELQNVQQYLPAAPSLPTLPVAPIMPLTAAPTLTTAPTKPQTAEPVMAPLASLAPLYVTYFPAFCHVVRVPKLRSD